MGKERGEHARVGDRGLVVPHGHVRRVRHIASTRTYVFGVSPPPRNIGVREKMIDCCAIVQLGVGVEHAL